MAERIVQKLSDGKYRFKDAEETGYQVVSTKTKKVDSTYKDMASAKRWINSSGKQTTHAIKKVKLKDPKWQGGLLKDATPEKNKKFEAIKKKMHKDYKTSYAIIHKGKLAGPDDISDQDMDKLYKQYVK